MYYIYKVNSDGSLTGFGGTSNKIEALQLAKEYALKYPIFYFAYLSRLYQ